MATTELNFWGAAGRLGHSWIQQKFNDFNFFSFMLFKLPLCLLFSSIGALKFSEEDFNGNMTLMGQWFLKPVTVWSCKNMRASLSFYQ
jgi:hypothetical protein